MPVLINPSIRTLERAPQRALKFLTASSRNLEIKALLEAVGLDAEVRRQGWLRIHAVSAPGERTPVVIFDPKVVEAVRHLDRFDNHYLPIVDVTLRYNHPQAYDIVFAGGLEAADGDASVLVSRKLVERVESLGEAPRALLAKRGLTAEKLAEARGWLALVEGVDLALLDAPVEAIEAAEDEGVVFDDDAADEDPDEAGDAGPVDRAWYQASLELWRWLDEWTTIASRVLTRRTHLIQLGLARRKARPMPSA